MYSKQWEPHLIIPGKNPVERVNCVLNLGLQLERWPHEIESRWVKKMKWRSSPINVSRTSEPWHRRIPISRGASSILWSQSKPCCPLFSRGCSWKTTHFKYHGCKWCCTLYVMETHFGYAQLLWVRGGENSRAVHVHKHGHGDAFRVLGACGLW